MFTILAFHTVNHALIYLIAAGALALVVWIIIAVVGLLRR